MSRNDPPELSEKDHVVKELFDTYAWGIVCERIKIRIEALRKEIFNSSTAAETRLKCVEQIVLMQQLFQSLYLEVGVDMPADFRKSFE